MEPNIVGWLWPYRGKEIPYCHAHKPTPPDDMQCTPVYAEDYDGERCECCEEPLVAASQSVESSG